MEPIAATFDTIPLASAASVSRAAESWKAERGRYPRFVVIEHVDPDSGQGCVLFAQTNIFASDARPADRAGMWILDTDGLDESAVTAVRP